MLDEMIYSHETSVALGQDRLPYILVSWNGKLQRVRSNDCNPYVYVIAACAHEYGVRIILENLHDCRVYSSNWPNNKVPG